MVDVVLHVEKSHIKIPQLLKMQAPQKKSLPKIVLEASSLFQNSSCLMRSMCKIIAQTCLVDTFTVACRKVHNTQHECFAVAPGIQD